jgi:hypothetical protein
VPKQFTTTRIAAQHEESMYRALMRAMRETQKAANIAEFTRQMERGNVEQALRALGLEDLDERLDA